MPDEKKIHRLQHVRKASDMLMDTLKEFDEFVEKLKIIDARKRERERQKRKELRLIPGKKSGSP